MIQVSALRAKVTSGSLRRVILKIVQDYLREARIAKLRELVKSDEEFVQTSPAPLSRHHSLVQTVQEIENGLHKLASDFPTLVEMSRQISRLVKQLMDPKASARDFVLICRHILGIQASYLGTLDTEKTEEVYISSDANYITVHVYGKDADQGSNATVPEQNQFLHAVCQLIESLRHDNQKPGINEFIAIRVAYALLDQGKQLDYPYRPWGNSGFRDTQTYMSVTDPGEGHLSGTCSNQSYLKGVIVHIEHLERGHQDKDRVEAYRIPAISTIGKVRLHVGSDAPTSSYVGRPVFETDHFESSLLKTVHTLAGACTAIFMDGLTECKIAIEGMTASQAIEFMQAMNGAIRRDKFSQCISAAFNLNTPIIDDRNGKAPTLVTDKMQIGLLGIELAREGGFDKVTWDGAANTYPSTCVLEQLTHEQAATLVHRAHELGLLTYFSAGFRFHHLPDAVHTGVDGVGVGGAQILRYMDKATGYHGPFKPQNISEILRIRDEAASGWLGTSASILARLDQMYFEGSITHQDNLHRLELFSAMCKKDQKQCIRLLNSVRHVLSMDMDRDHPLIERANRLIDAADSNPLLAQVVGAGRWNSFVQKLSECVAERDIGTLADELVPYAELEQPNLLVA